MQFAHLTAQACYQAMKSHDTRFDGRFFVGVSSTGVYCRPICRVRLPQQKNCTFHPSAAAAEAAGFRPCLKCRPELAPGFAATEASAKLARSAARMIEDGVANDVDLAQVARRVGVTDRHLRRIFADEFGVSPVQYAQTHRLLLAKRLLTDTALPVTDVAYASGFTSVRRMNTLFAERYGFSPTRLRKEGRDEETTASAALTFMLPYRPPYDWPRLLAFLAMRAVPGVESVDGEVYRRIVRVAPAHPLASDSAPTTGWLEVSHLPRRDALQLRFSAALAKASQRVLSRTKQVFDVAADPAEIVSALGPLSDGAPGLRLPGAFDGFELAMRAVLGQQVTVKAARTLATRFVDAFGEAVTSPFAALTRAFPQPSRVAVLTRDDIGRLGIVGARADAMIAIARAMNEDQLTLAGGADPAKTIAALCAIKGIGPWTAHYIAMRALAWPDAWPPQDVALLNAMNLPNTVKGQRQADAIAEAWRPWRSYAVLHTWRRLEKPVAGTENESKT
ncbi:MAG: helix-turn-helix domain-containing protein [Burkholderiales bacterium]|nr:helix-turn-helix domain-containing protein [Burkholderiales bacterium]